MKNNNAGFSLVELMVVVAIIGILATIAIPNFNKFQNKAKQASAKAELTNVFVAEKAFFSEYSVYHDNLPYIGFVPEGLVSSGNCPTATGTNLKKRYYSTGFASSSGGTVGGLPAPACTTAAASAYYGSTNAAGTALNTASTGLGATLGVGATSFSAGAVGTLSGTDTWSMDNNQALVNATSGI